MRKPMWVFLALLVILCLWAGVAPAETTAAAGDAAIVFTDAPLEAKVRESMGKPTGDITVSEAASVSRLDLGGREEIPDSDRIHDIESLRYFTNITSLALFNQSLTDIGALSALQSLKTIDLTNNRITDLSPLEGSGVEELWLAGNQISDISPLATLNKVQQLDLRVNQIADYSPLAGLSTLKKLYLNENATQDCSPLIPLGATLEETDFTMAVPAATLTGGIVFGDDVLESKIREALNKPEGDITAETAATLTWLDASLPGDAADDSRIKSIDALRYFVNLDGINLNNNAVSDITPLKGLTRLTQLWLNGNPLEDKTPLGDMTGLIRLGFDGGFQALPFLASLTQLEELNIGGCKTLPPEILGMKKLKTLCAAGGELSDISLLEQMPQLTALDISWNLVSDLSPIKDLKLVELYIAGDPITDYSPLRNSADTLQGTDFNTALVTAYNVPEDPLPIPDANLERALRDAMNIHDRPITLRDAYVTEKLDINYVDGAGEPYSDISPLSAFTHMYALNIENNQVSDLSPLASLKALSWLSARNNRITDLSPLLTANAAQTLYLEGNPIADVTPLTGIEPLRVLYLERQPVCDYAPLDAIFSKITDTNLQAIPDSVPNEPIPMPDPNLLPLLRQVTKVKDRDITWRDAYRIYEIQVGVESMWQGVSDISSLACFQNLERLMIFGSQVSDLSPLVKLQSLRFLGVDDSAVSDLTALGDAKQLGYLELKNNQITDVTPLANLTQLDGLDVSYNQIADLSPLYALQKLNVLYISHNLTTDASGFKSIAKGLKGKDFDPDQPMETANPDAESTPQPQGDSGKTDVQGDNGKPDAQSDAGSADSPALVPDNPDEVIAFKDHNLEKAVRNLLSLGDQPLTRGIAAGVTVLDFTKTEGGDANFTDLTPLGAFLNLTELRLVGNGIKSIAALAPLTGMRQLQLDCQSIADLTPLSGMIHLQTLSLKENKISKLAPLSGLTALRTLELTGNKVKDLKPLAAVTSLEALYLAKDPVADLSPLSGLSNLRVLHIKDTKVKDVSPLASLTNLRELMAEGSKVKDFSPIANLYPTLEGKDFTLE
ncbi:MAG TPA: leucine-rich repeat domain-containing protein [Candidatus Limiplasma sp.]|nr:leucine-rich repeat domain-containing protein [Candidatus Limiplasma sp.]HPS80824.1 leucine-rich repeat domain-containing protein [Candidatus Limiplasma sp.]